MTCDRSARFVEAAEALSAIADSRRASSIEKQPACEEHAASRPTFSPLTSSGALMKDRRARRTADDGRLRPALRSAAFSISSIASRSAAARGECSGISGWVMKRPESRSASRTAQISAPVARDTLTSSCFQILAGSGIAERRRLSAMSS